MCVRAPFAPLPLLSVLFSSGRKEKKMNQEPFRTVFVYYVCWHRVVSCFVISLHFVFFLHYNLTLGKPTSTNWRCVRCPSVGQSSRFVSWKYSLSWSVIICFPHLRKNATQMGGLNGTGKVRRDLCLAFNRVKFSSWLMKFVESSRFYFHLSSLEIC